jgi:membrane protease YdiL (CAAX protease family)
MKQLIRSHTLTAFFILAYAITWIAVLPLALRMQTFEPQTFAYEGWHALGALGPTLAALVVLRFLSEESRKQFRDNFQVKSLFRPLPLVLTLSPLILLAGALVLDYLISGEWFRLGAFLSAKGIEGASGMAVYLLPMVAYGVFEEIGWRGFALPGLQRRFRAMPATLILGLLWAGWHFPMFFYRFDYDLATTIGFVVGLLFGAFLLTAIYNSSKGSVIATIIWHVLWNLVSPLDPEGLSTYMSMGIMAMVIVIFWRWGWRTLSSNGEMVTKNYY